MNLRGIVSVTGKPGLYRVIGQNKAGFILETMDGLKNKLITLQKKIKTAIDSRNVKLKIDIIKIGNKRRLYFFIIKYF